MGVRVQLARAWGVSPAELRGVTLAELVAMGAVLEAEAQAMREARH
jgi:hypothetical protein